MQKTKLTSKINCHSQLFIDFEYNVIAANRLIILLHDNVDPKVAFDKRRRKLLGVDLVL